MPSGPSDDPGRKHLFIVCSNPCENGEVVVVGVTGWTNNLCDGTTKLTPGCHGFIVKDSWMMYRACRIISAELIDQEIDAGTFLPKPSMSDPPLKQIIDGILASPHTKRRIKAYLAP